jgi:hypothetical protein
MAAFGLIFYKLDPRAALLQNGPRFYTRDGAHRWSAQPSHFTTTPSSLDTPARGSTFVWRLVWPRRALADRLKLIFNFIRKRQSILKIYRISWPRFSSSSIMSGGYLRERYAR